MTPVGWCRPGPTLTALSDTKNLCRQRPPRHYARRSMLVWLSLFRPSRLSNTEYVGKSISGTRLATRSLFTAHFHHRRPSHGSTTLCSQRSGQTHVILTPKPSAPTLVSGSQSCPPSAQILSLSSGWSIHSEYVRLRGICTGCACLFRRKLD